VRLQYFARIKSCFPPVPSFPKSPDYPRGDDTRLSPLPPMPGLPSSFDPQNPRSPAWICTCRKCGSNGKVLPKRTWYNHNPGGKAALYDATTERGREGIKRLYALHRPAYEAQDQRLYGEVEGVEDPSRASKRVATSSSVRPMLFHDSIE